VIKAIICCAIAACGLDHRDANASVMKFLMELAKASRNHEVSNVTLFDLGPWVVLGFSVDYLLELLLSRLKGEI
jgi:transportin-3